MKKADSMSCSVYVLCIYINYIYVQRFNVMKYFAARGGREGKNYNIIIIVGYLIFFKIHILTVYLLVVHKQIVILRSYLRMYT